MLKHVLRVYVKIVVAAYRIFGFGRVLAQWLFVMPACFLFTRLTLFLDNIFFPGYRKAEVRSPVFLIGHPRSGTTFLHRLLTQTDDYVVFEFWHLIFPSLTARKMLKPVIDLLKKKGKDVVFPASCGHELKLGSIEEEEVLFCQNLDSQFVTLFSPVGFHEKDYDELCHHDTDAHRTLSVRFFRDCLKRQVYYTGKKTVLTKMNYSTMRIQTLLEVFPDAKIVYLARSPLETIPSHLSLHARMFGHVFGEGAIPESTMKKYMERRYRHNVELYRYFYDLRNKGVLSDGQVLEVNYADLFDNLKEVLREIVAFTGIEVSSELQAKFEEQYEKQKSFKRKHKNMSIRDFGLSEDGIRADLDFIFERYRFDEPVKR